MKSRTLVMDESGAIERREVELPDLGPNDVLVRVELTGICGSDVHMRDGGLDLDYPVVPGHEFAGIVEAVGDEVTTDSKGDLVSSGDKVTVVPGISCGDCWYCDNLPTRPLACNDRNVYGFRSVEQAPHAHGGMSEYFVIEGGASFYTLPEDVPVELGALVEPLSVASHAVERAFQPGVPHAREGFGIGKSVAVQGAGPIGMLTAATARAAGAGQVIALDMIDERLEMAERFGATDTVNVGEYDGDGFVEAVNELTPSGDGPDVVVEAVGHPSALEQAIEIPRNAGTVVEVGHYAYNGEAAIDPSRLVHKELNVFGSLAYPPVQFETAISLLDMTRDERPYEELFNYRVGFDDAEAAYEKQASGEAYRATIHPGR
ncbi:zinc-dependent alcohol dehydrogenase [Halegenticoccus soli]|uniref:zinc-dependent alcohol dehydrogenase n=1 Tax=Halegenticoccus soli TaxID=1985678 RepID=UPI000C6C9F68|nr:zinc-binding dehydrogenase [Halegenticoccus soli]